jgi:predicted HTH domain antitoxin
MRQWLHQGAAHYALQLVAGGRLSLAHAAELLGVTIYDLYLLAETHGVELGATDEQRRRSRRLAATLGRRDG